jgi:hypothetical protein
MSLSKRKKRIVVFCLLLAAFLFRLCFGLCSDLQTDDPKQIYLIGLKFFTTRTWPYFGPDVSAAIQIPGALQGFVVGLPFFVLQIPEAPYIFLNLLTFSSLCFFAWYCCKRLPEMPKWFVWSWLFLAPWTLNVSTHIYNPSYVLPGAILFFVGALETLPFLSMHLVPARWANFMMGISVFWIMQFHLSWPVLVPYVLLSFYFQLKTEGRRAIIPLGYFPIGSAITGVFLLPTFLKFGAIAGMGGANKTVAFNSANLLRHLNIVEGVLGRFLSFASFELPRFIGDNTATRLAFMREHRWLIPLVVLLTITGILQCVALLILWFRRNHPTKDWKAVKYFTLATIVLLYLSFLFSIKAPVSHTFYVTFPVAMLYSLYCWSPFLSKLKWKKFAVGFLACAIVFEIGLAAHNYSHVSLYLERSKIAEAIKTGNYHVFGERRLSQY